MNIGVVVISFRDINAFSAFPTLMHHIRSIEL